MEDGKISPNEQSMLNKIEAGLKAAKDKVHALEEEFKANKKKWESRDGDWQNFKKQYDELVEWGDPNVPVLKGSLNDTTAKAHALAWLDAISGLDRAMVVIKAPYAEYTKQKPFEKKYNASQAEIADAGSDKKKHMFAAEANVAKS